MAFVRTLPSHFNLVHLNSAVTSILMIGYDDDETTTYSAAVSLSRNPTLEYELSFWVVETTGDGDAYELRDGRSTRFLRGSDRKFTLDVIATAAKLCVDRLLPVQIHMLTYESGLPEKALIKYRHIARHIQISGYQVREAESYYGKRLWAFERLENR